MDGGAPQGRPPNDKHAGLAGSIEVASDEINLWALLEGGIDEGAHRPRARDRQLGLLAMHMHAQDGDIVDATARLGPGQPDAVPRVPLEGAVPQRLDVRLRA